MKKFRFYAHFKGGDKATDWIYCDSENLTAGGFLTQYVGLNSLLDDKGGSHYINWDNVNYAKCEDVK
jgi:hypothetical protein